jgi:hypothetical protein
MIGVRKKKAEVEWKKESYQKKTTSMLAEKKPPTIKHSVTFVIFITNEASNGEINKKHWTDCTIT